MINVRRRPHPAPGDARRGPARGGVWPARPDSRRSGAGAHQLARPPMRMAAGTRIARITVASTSTATATRRRASAGTPQRSPVPQAGGDGGAGVAGARVLLGDPGQQEHLVVHGQAVGDAQHEDRDARVDAAGRREPEHGRQVAVLVDPDDDAEHHPAGSTPTSPACSPRYSAGAPRSCPPIAGSPSPAWSSPRSPR